MFSTEQKTNTTFPADRVGIPLATTRNLRRYAKGMQCLLGQLNKLKDAGDLAAARLVSDGIRIPNTCRLEGALMPGNA
jgi:hypothetical protein